MNWSTSPPRRTPGLRPQSNTRRNQGVSLRPQSNTRRNQGGGYAAIVSLRLLSIEADYHCYGIDYTLGERWFAIVIAVQMKKIMCLCQDTQHVHIVICFDRGKNARLIDVLHGRLVAQTRVPGSHRNVLPTSV